MARKEKKGPQGAPDWLVTYGDMMTLLLCFFVLMFSYRVVADEERMSNVLGELKASVNRSLKADEEVLGIAELSEEVDVPTLMDRLRDTGAEVLSIEGVEVRVSYIDEGLKYRFTGKPLFDLGSSKLTAKGRESVRVLGIHLRGYKYKIEIRGFTSAAVEEKIDGSHWRLAYKRAASVSKIFLDTKAVGIEPKRLRLWSGGKNALISLATTEPMGRERNRRVEIVVFEIFADEYNEQGD